MHKSNINKGLKRISSPFLIFFDDKGYITGYNINSDLEKIISNLKLKAKEIKNNLSINKYIDFFKIKEKDKNSLKKKLRSLLNKKISSFEYYGDFILNNSQKHLHIESYRLSSANYILIIRDDAYQINLKEEYENSIKLFKQSIGTVAREFKSPIVSVSGFSKILLKKLNNRNEKKYLQFIIESISNLEDMIEKYLVLNEIEEGIVLQKKNVMLCKEVIEPVIEGLLNQIKFYNIDIEHDPNLKKNDIIIYTDPRYLKIIYSNLFSNAIKYGGKRTKISYSIKEKKDYFEINVWNSKSWINKKEKKIIFNKFSRIINDRTSGIKGTGLGLYNTKMIVEKLGGVIKVDSDNRSYTNFIFTLPKVDNF